MKSILLVLTLAFCTKTMAAVTWSIRETSPNVAQTAFDKRLNLQADTQVQHPRYSMLIPKGWSCAQGADSKTEVLTCAPNQDIATSKIFLAINRRLEKSAHTIQGSFDQFKKNPNRNTVMRTTNGSQWVVSTQELSNPPPSKQWTLISIKNENEFILLASVPHSDLNKYQSDIEKMLGSIVLK